MKKPVYITGHKNPDTDAIVSAIAYAEYKKLNGINAIPVRIGSINNETEFLLEKFGYEDPQRLYTARSLLNEIDMDKAIVVSKNMTMKEALNKTLKAKSRGLVIANRSKHLEGLISIDDLTNMWLKSDKELEYIISKIKTADIVKTLKGKIVVSGNKKLSGKMHMFPSLRSNVEQGSIVLLRNEDDKIIYCLNKDVSIIVLATSCKVSKKVCEIAKANNTTIITTQLSALSISRLIYQTPSIENIMQSKEKIVYFNYDDTVIDASKKITQTRHRSYPVIDDEGKIIGAISRYHLFNYEKKKFILVDHNEYKQTIENIEDAEILEIVDHHRIGGFESNNPIRITTMPVGSTSTIIANMFIDTKTKLNKKLAGLLLGAIISDTMNFKSPTTTQIDLNVARQLERISGQNSSKLSSEMIEHIDSLLSKRFIEVVYDDFKEFNIEGVKVGLAQATCKSKEEYMTIKKDLQNYLDDSSKSGGYELLMIMLTNPNGSGSYVLSAGTRKSILNDMYKNIDNNGYVKGLVSRKKQLLPLLISTLGENK